jgi:predicted CXXCH cytochrome family protein
MSNASGPAKDGFIAADFDHAASGIHYRIYQESGHVWLSYQRNDLARMLDGRQELRYFLGSGKRGRTYLFEEQGYWFEAPINWYAKKQMWDMTPHYLAAQQMPLTLPVDPGCLHCHTSGAASSLPDARNHYAGEPFRSGGIGCASCHGDSSAHVASGGRVATLNIDALEPVRRDSVCLNCHLEGQAVVERAGKQIERFVPGENLFDYAVYFVYKGENGSGGRATSQWEALLKSQCKQVSGDKLTCTTCHDPHGSPAPEQRVEFYRQRCLGCHNTPGFTQRHFPEDPDCTRCHMARPPSNDIAHEQVTDHWIKTRVSQERLPLATGGELVAVGGAPASDRDLGLGYAQMAAHGDEAAARRAMDLLRKADTGAEAAHDRELHAQLGFLEQIDGETGEAAREYRKALDIDPFDALAAGDLALIEARGHNPAEAIRLWGSVVEHHPAQLTAAMNLAVVECSAGDRDQALQTLERMLVFSPDDQKARSFLGQIRAGRLNCGTR